MATTSSAKIILAGGFEIHATSMMMYEEAQLQEAATLWQEAERKLGAPGSGIGFMGSPDFVLGAFATASIFAKWQRAKLGRDAAELIEAANQKYRRALDTGREFDWAAIEGADWSDPTRWQAMAFEDLKRKIFVTKPDGEFRIRTTEGGWIWVMWRQVAAYEPMSTESSTA